MASTATVAIAAVSAKDNAACKCVLIQNESYVVIRLYWQSLIRSGAKVIRHFTDVI
jgi:hypothetical protein